MKSTIKIATIAMSGVLISFFCLVAFLSEFPDPITVLQKKFYMQTFDSTNKILIVGSSHTGNLNATLINDKVSDTNERYIVYNLSYNNDVPTKRLETINQIIGLKPKIVLYGISYREFSSLNTQDSNEKNTQQFYLQNLFLKKFGGNFDNPQFVTLQLTRNTEKDDSFRQSLTPFFEYHPNQLIIKDNSDIKKEFIEKHDEFLLDSEVEKSEVFALKEIIDELNRNNIKIIIFTTPYQRVFLDSVSMEQKQEFDTILNDLTRSVGKVYRMDEKYADLPIWYNYDHVAYNTKAAIYSNDIADIIIKEIKN